MAFCLWSRIATSLCAFAVLSVVSPSLAQVTTTYSYDRQGQVTAVTRPANTVTYGYDAAGNRIALNVVYPAPGATTASLSVPFGGSASLALPVSGQVTGAAVDAAPAKGSVSISGTTATYIASGSNYGVDSFTYHAVGPGGNSPAQTISVTIANPPAPAANDTALSVAYNSSASSNLSVSGVVTGLVIDGNPSKGTVSVSGATATYTATWPNYGADSFTYHAIGPGGSSPVRTVAVTIGNGAPPTASDGAITTGFNTPITFTYPKAGDYAVAVLDSSPAHGSVSAPTWVSGVGYQSVYTPTAGYSGADAFTFHASSPFGASPVRTISVTVAPPPPPPAPTVAAASINSTYNGSGAVVLPVSGVYTSIGFPGGSPAHGTLNLTGATVTYYPTSGYYGADSFTYNATGPGGTSGTATVSVTVANPPAPTVSAVSASTAYNTAKAIALSPSGVYTSLAVAGGPSHGSASISGATATYTPTSGYSGADSFTYTATGPGGTSGAATVSVTVAAAPPNNPPVAVNDTGIQLYTNGTVTVDVVANDTDADGDALTVSAISATSTSKATYSFSGRYITINAKTVKGSDSITYTVSDGRGGTATATLGIFVNYAE